MTSKKFIDELELHAHKINNRGERETALLLILAAQVVDAARMMREGVTLDGGLAIVHPTSLEVGIQCFDVLVGKK